MERRDFIKKATIGSTCTLAGANMVKNVSAAAPQPEYAVKITVLERALKEQWSLEFRGKETERCQVFSDGQEFMVESPWSAPEGFCQWAWADIRTFIHLVNSGQYETFVSCCTDGFRPVFFKIERVEK